MLKRKIPLALADHDDSKAGSPKVTELRRQLTAHPMYSRLDCVRNIRRFMEAHVFAVWDFVSLLKALQRALTCVDLPWVSREDSQLTRLVNEIVLGEESDKDGRGGFRSHFELYREAMAEFGADRTSIDRFVGDLRAGRPWEQALADARVPPYIEQFVRNTLSVALSGQVHRVAAAFFYGREDVIPDMFRTCLPTMERHTSQTLDRFSYYLARHIEVDGETHGPLARRMMLKLCGDDRVRHCEAIETATAALRSRLALWDSVLANFEPTFSRGDREGEAGLLGGTQRVA